MKIITVYSCQEWDGGEHYHHRFYMENKQDSVKWAGKYNHIAKRELVIYEDLEDLKKNDKESLKKQALLKLTKEERHALGFS